jgi:two-component system, NarL family, response regulator
VIATVDESRLTRVLVVEDHPATRAGILAVIAQMPGFTAVGTADCVAAAVSECQRVSPDVVLMDLRLKAEDGVDAIRQIRLASADAKVLVLTTFDGDEVIHRAWEAGARGYILKDSSLTDIEAAIRTVAGGKHYLPADVATRLVQHGPRIELTNRENEILVLLADGLRNKEIAARLSLGEATVRSHVQAIIGKFGCHDRGAVISRAIARGFLATGSREVGQR